MVEILLDTYRPPKNQTKRIMKTILPKQEIMEVKQGDFAQKYYILNFYERKHLSPTQKAIANVRKRQGDLSYSLLGN